MSDYDPIAAALDDETAPARDRYAEGEAKDLLWLMSSRRGRRVVFRLMEKAGSFGISFSPDAALTAFREGQRNVMQPLMALFIAEASEQFASMLKEHQDDVRRNADDR